MKPGNRTAGLVAASLLTAATVRAQAPAEPATVGTDLVDDARVLMRVVACEGDAKLPAAIDAKVVAAHCEKIRPRLDAYRKKYVEGAQRFLSGILPRDLPATVVYPFGGGDLVTALTAYPDAREITTLSLEHAGDVRRVRRVDPKKLEKSVGALTSMLTALLEVESFSRSLGLSTIQQGELPGELSFFVTALAVHGYEPLALKVFRLEADGRIHYLSAEEIAAAERVKAKRVKKSWTDPDFSEAFSHVEITFRKRGDPGAPLKVHRHIAANLHDSALEKDDRALKHLVAKGRVAALIKAASYLLWQPGFSKIREYLIAYPDYTLSESSGIPPRFLDKRGLVQETYGDFEKAYLPDASEEISRELEQLWKSQPHRDLPFRFGYPDHKLRNHLLVTRRERAAGAAPSTAGGAR